MKLSYRIASLLAVTIAAGLFTYFVLTGRTQQGKQQTQQGVQQQRPAATVESAELTHSEGGKLRWKALVDRIELEKGGEAVAAYGLREGIIYDESGRPSLHVTAKTIKGDSARKNFQLTGDVVVTSPEGFVIKTQKVHWINDDQRIHCPEAVRMKANDVIIATVGMNYLVGPNLVKCPNQVHMYSGDNQIAGRNLVYSVDEETVELHKVQMVINPHEAREIVKEWEEE